MGLKFDGLVTAVSEPHKQVVSKGDTSVDVTKLRVVNESGPYVDKELDDGSTVKDRQYKDYYDVEAWGSTAKALARVNVGETVHVGGEIRATQGREKPDGEMFYPKDTLRITSLDFIGVNKAAAKGRVAQAVASVDAEVGANTVDSSMAPSADLDF